MEKKEHSSFQFVEYADFYKEKERRRYLKKLDINHRLLSLEGFTDSEGKVLDFIVDETVDVAETVIHAAMADSPLVKNSENRINTLNIGIKHRRVGHSVPPFVKSDNIL